MRWLKKRTKRNTPETLELTASNYNYVQELASVSGLSFDAVVNVIIQEYRVAAVAELERRAKKG